jgi:uncharacterized integral membrane protein (TIGR00698 family)
MSWMSAVWTKEDWWSVWVGFALLASVFVGAVSAVPGLPRWSSPMDGVQASPIIPLIVLMLGIGLLTSIAVWTLGQNARAYLRAFPAVFGLTTAAFFIAANDVLAAYGLGYAMWALLIGLLISNFVGTPEWLRPAVRTELFIKTGLVILGAEVVFSRILELGSYGLIVAWGVTPVVLISMFWLGGRLELTPSFSIVVAAATSVCGVSAAIAAAGASRAKKEELTLAVGMTLVFTVLMMVGMPLISEALGLDPIMAGAWIGGTVDSTGAVVAAGQILGDDAMQTAAIVKMIQNLLIGLIAFAIALYWVARIEPGVSDSPRLAEIWNRFPKFVLGFIGASVLVSFVLLPMLGDDTVDGALDVTSDYRSWFFCLAFLSIGLESDFRQLGRQMGRGRPLVLYLVGQTFNVLLTLLVVWLVFSGLVFPPMQF